jgi:peroxiredoxin
MVASLVDPVTAADDFLQYPHYLQSRLRVESLGSSYSRWKEGKEMASADEHDVHLPAGPFELMAELGRFRNMRDDVIPATITSLMDTATEELVEGKLADQVVGVGSEAPGFSLPNASGQQVTLSQMLARGPVVISFYRGIWCPFCNLEQRALQQYLPEINRLGASLVAISGQTPDNSLSMAEKNELTYEVLSDVGLTVATSYGLVFRLPGYLQDAYERLGHPLPMFNGTGEQTLPLPATFVIARDGIVRFAYANPDYTHRADPKDILAVLESIT